MIQDIAPAVFHNEFHPRPPKGKDILLDFKGHEIALKKDGGFFTWPLAGVTDPLWLFDIDDTGIFLSDLSSFAPDYRSIFEMRYVRPLKDAFLAVTAWHLSCWYNDNRFCGSDGTRLVPSKTERALQCPHCGRIIYPRTPMDPIAAMPWWPAIARSAKHWKTPSIVKSKKKRASTSMSCTTTSRSHGVSPARCWPVSGAAPMVTGKYACSAMNWIGLSGAGAPIHSTSTTTRP